MSHHRDRRRASVLLRRLLPRLPGIEPGTTVREATDDEQRHYHADAAIERPGQTPLRVGFQTFSNGADFTLRTGKHEPWGELDQVGPGNFCDWYLLDRKAPVRGRERHTGAVILDLGKMIGAGLFTVAQSVKWREHATYDRSTHFHSIGLRELHKDGYFVFSLNRESGKAWYR
jgi:hypothetical protein